MRWWWWWIGLPGKLLTKGGAGDIEKIPQQRKIHVNPLPPCLLRGGNLGKPVRLGGKPKRDRNGQPATTLSFTWNSKLAKIGKNASPENLYYHILSTFKTFKRLLKTKFPEKLLPPRGWNRCIFSILPVKYNWQPWTSHVKQIYEDTEKVREGGRPARNLGAWETESPFGS